jgi:phosphoribosylaminoimidazole (AIR) synthetase
MGAALSEEIAKAQTTRIFNMGMGKLIRVPAEA